MFSRSRPKIFVVGFNKTGTKSLHFFLTANGYRSVHGKQKPWHGLIQQPFIAVTMEDNLAAGRPVLSGLESYRAYSDLTYDTATRHIEANAFFREFHAAAPDAYFIFNDRPVEHWLRSRCNHVSARSGSFLENQMQLNGLSREATLDMWRTLYTTRKAEICDYFAGNPRFMIFDIEADPPQKLARFLAADFSLDCGKWAHLGKARLPAKQAA
ncbi:MAG: sulfotransferase [Planctomycetia bacterium]